jgi:hypothetical protein
MQDCHSGLVKRDPESRRRPGESREPFYALGHGFHREPWIPASAGMTTTRAFAKGRAMNEWLLALI